LQSYTFCLQYIILLADFGLAGAKIIIKPKIAI